MASNSKVVSHAAKHDTMLEWLADSPLFIDGKLLEQFYDAVVRPEKRKGKTTIEESNENTKTLKGNLSLEVGAEVSTGQLLAKIGNLFPSIKISPKIKTDIAKDSSNKSTNKEVVELYEIDNPHRQLVHLTIYYLLRHRNRVLLVDRLSDYPWNNQEDILGSPRNLVFLDLPSLKEANEKSLPEVKFFPMAAEFMNGKVVILFKDPDLIKGVQDPQPSYYGTEDHKEFWKWQYDNYDANRAMEVVEKHASDNNKIRWIDYRLPVSLEGSTLHLHFSPAENYSTGDFAYNLIKRGADHGLRLVGTLKSGPSINVLAVFEK